MDWINNIIAIIKLPIKIIVGIAIFSGSLFIIPNALLLKLKLNSFVDEFGTFIGIAFYAATVLIIVNIIAFCIKKIKDSYIQKKNKQAAQQSKEKAVEKITNKLSLLDPHEKAVLREFIIQGKNTIEIPIDHHVVVGLINSRVIEVASNYVTRNILIGLLTSVRLSETAQNIIFENPEIIGIPKRKPNEQEKKDVISARPDFIRQIEEFNSLYRR
jgi:hypothetical protein